MKHRLNLKKVLLVLDQIVGFKEHERFFVILNVQLNLVLSCVFCERL